MLSKLTLKNYFFKKWLLPACIGMFAATGSFAQNGVAINTTGAAADPSAILDLKDLTINKGLLLPQVASTGLVTSPATGLVVYQTNSPTGIYCNTGTPLAPVWIQLSSASGNGNYILNQNASVQTPGTFNIAGSGTMVGLTSTGAAVSLNSGSNNTTITASGNSTIAVGGTGNSITNITSGNGVNGAVNINVGNNSPTNINTASSNGNVTIGNSGNNLLLPKFGTVGSILYSSTAGGQIAGTVAGTATTILHGGATPSFSAVSLTADVTGILPIANGGTGVSNTAPALSVFGNSANAIGSPGFITGATNGKYLGVRGNILGYFSINAGDVANSGIVTTTGNASATQVAFWKTNTSLSGNNNLWWDSTLFRLGIGTNAPGSTLTVAGDLTSSGGPINLNAAAAANANPININTGGSTGTVTIGGTTAQAIYIGKDLTGNGASPSTITIGSTADGLTTNIFSGANGVNINTAALNRPTNINTGSATGSVTIGSSALQAINLGVSTTGIVTLGGTSTGTTNINSASSGYPTGGINFNYNNSKPININTGTNNTGSVTIGGTNTSTNQIITVGGSGLQTVNLGASVGTGSIVTVGNGGGDANTSQTNIKSGTGGVNINVTNNQPTNINTGTTNKDVTIGNTNSNLILPKFSTAGSILYSSTAGGVVAVTAAGTSGQVLTSNGAGAPTWTTPTTGTVTSVGTTPPLSNTGTATAPIISLTGIVPVANGGTGVATAAAYTVFGNHTNAAAAPSFGKVDLANEVTGVLPIANGGTNIGTIGAAGSVIYSNGTQYVSTAVGTAGQVLTSNGAGGPLWAAAATGTVTSVGLTLPNIFTVSGSPVTTSGTLTGTLVNQSANTVFAGPVSGIAAAPAFRALVAADLPSGNGNYIQNQNVVTQTADFKISGTGTLNALISNASITNTGTITSTGGAINLNSTGSSNFATNINTGTSTGGVTIGGTGTQNIALGSTGTTSATTIVSGSGGVNINTGTNTGTVTIGSTGNQIISIGSSISNGTITLGNSANDPVATNIFGGIGGGVNINNNVNKNLPTNINTGATTGNITIGSINNNLILPRFSTAGTVYYSAAGGVVTGLAPTSNGQVLTLNAGLIPTWTTPTTGTVTTFSSGNLSPLFTTSVANANTTPALSFALTNASANTVFGNFTNALAAPSYNPASADGQFLVRRSGALTFGIINSADLPSLATNYIVNGSGVQASANFNISGNGTIGGNLSVTGTSTLTGAVTSNAGVTNTGILTSSGAAISLNNNSNFATNINTGTSTGIVTIGNAANNINFPKLSASAVVLTDAAKNLTSATILPIVNGGTNGTAAPTAGGIAYGTGSAYAFTAAGTNGQVLTSNGAGAPAWAAASGGTVTSFGVAGSLSPLFTTLVSNPSSTPVLTFTQSNANAHTFFGNFTNASALPTFGSPNLASADFANQGTATTVLHGNGAGNPSWGAVNLTSDVSNILPIANGGTNIGTIGSAGSVVYSNGTQHVFTAAGTIGQVLTSNGAGAPTWATSANGTVTTFSSGDLSPLFTTSVANANTTPALSFSLSNATAYTVFGNHSASLAAPTFGKVDLINEVMGILPIANGGTNNGTLGSAGSVIYSNGTQHVFTAVGAIGQVLTSNGAGAPTWSAAATGTVTSVALSLPNIFTVSASPVTTSGTLTGALATQNANLVFAGPASGAAAAPTFRTLVAADLPVGSGSYIQSQSASSQNASYWIDGPASIGTSTFNSSNQLDVAISGANNNALVAVNTAAAGTGNGDGVEGITNQSQGTGVRGINTNTSGTGVIGVGNNEAAVTLSTGSGGAFAGSTTGIYSKYTSTADGSSALYTEDNVGNIVEVNAYSSGTQYKIIGAGNVSTTAENIDNTSKVVLHAPEAPEILFEDYGQGKLINGKAHINIDPVFSKNVAINDKHPLRVFIQLEGDCNGVYVANKSKTGFDVIELQKGNSNVNFQWHIVCNRANEVLGNGKISHNEDMRFEPAPPKMQILNSPKVLQKAKKN